jgi:hypothetical protein
MESLFQSQYIKIAYLKYHAELAKTWLDALFSWLEVEFSNTTVMAMLVTRTPIQKFK